MLCVWCHVVCLVQMSPEAMTCAWVQFLRFTRRAQSLKDARQTFLKASKVPDIGWQVCRPALLAPDSVAYCMLTTILKYAYVYALSAAYSTCIAVHALL